MKHTTTQNEEQVTDKTIAIPGGTVDFKTEIIVRPDATGMAVHLTIATPDGLCTIIMKRDAIDAEYQSRTLCG